MFFLRHFGFDFSQIKAHAVLLAMLTAVRESHIFPEIVSSRKVTGTSAAKS